MTSWPPTGCTYNPNLANAGQAVDGNDQTISIAFDSTNGKVLTAVYDSQFAEHPGLFRCDANGVSCTHTDPTGLALDAGIANGYYPHIVTDVPTNSLYIATQDNSNAAKPSLFRCAIDGTACKSYDFSAGQGAGTADSLSAVIDPVNKQLLVVAVNGAATPRKLGLFRIGLW